MNVHMSPSSEIKDLNKSPYHLLRRAWQFAGDIYADEAGANGLTHRQFTVLLAVGQNEGASQTDLVGLTGIDRSTLADLVARLIKRGLLQRKRTKEDARANSIRLSAAGKRALKSAQPAALTVDQKLLKAVPMDQRKQFMSALVSLSEALEEAHDEGHGNGNGSVKSNGKSA